MEDLISIVLTLYNKAPYIEETIFSVYKQTYSNWELIIVDDCSTDWSFEIAKSFCEKLWITEKCKFIKNEKNLGLSKNTLKWFSLSNGEYIALVDADDILMKNKLEKNISFCKNWGYDLCYSDLTTIDKNGEVKEKSFNDIARIWENKNSIKKIIKNGLCVASSMLLKKSLASEIVKIGIPDKIYQDHRIGIISCILWYKIGFIKESLVYYRRIPWNMSYKETANTNKKILTNWKNTLQELNLRCLCIMENKLIKKTKALEKYLGNIINTTSIYINYISTDDIIPPHKLIKLSLNKDCIYFTRRLPIIICRKMIKKYYEWMV